MKYFNGNLCFSPTDLVTYYESPFAAWLERAYFEGVPGIIPDGPNALNEILQQKGRDHEAKVLELLERRYGGVVKIDTKVGLAGAVDQTALAMKAGAKLIYQAAFNTNDFSGYADFIIRRGFSSNGFGSYEPCDSKLSGKIKDSHIIQLCAYAEMLFAAQGVLPERGLVALRDFRLHSFSINENWRDYLDVKQNFLKFQASFSPHNCPALKKSEKLWRWTDEAKRHVDRTDSLIQVDRLRNSQIEKLSTVGVFTFSDLVDTKSIPEKMDQQSFFRLKKQALLQAKTKITGRVAHEIRRDDLAKGFSRLPPVSDYDIYFDFEGFPFYEMKKNGFLEYLCGVVYRENGKSVFKDFWSHDRSQEEKLFNDFVDFCYLRWKVSKGKMKAFHYGIYEIVALKRLAKRYGAGSSKFQEMKRRGVFINMQSVFGGAIKVGAPSASLKKLESLYGFNRTADMNLAEASMVAYCSWLKNKDGDSAETSAVLRGIRAYNREDCLSLVGLTNFMRQVKAAEELRWSSAS